MNTDQDEEKSMNIGQIAFILTVWLLVGAIFGAGESDKEAELVYLAWQKLHPSSNLSQEEWTVLRAAYMLPGQQPPGSSIFAAAHIGLVAGRMTAQRALCQQAPTQPTVPTVTE